MARNLYVRVRPKSEVTTFIRGGFNFTLLWVLLTGLDDATAGVIENEQMLETSTKKPEGFDEQEVLTEIANRENVLQPDEATGLIGSSLLPVDITYDSGFEIAQVDLVQAVFDAAGLNQTAFNALPQDTRDLLLQVYVDRLNAQHVALESINGTVTSLSSQITTLNSTVSSLTSERDTARTSLSTVTGERDGLNSKVGTLETELTTLKGSVTKLEGDLKKANDALAKAKKPAAAKNAD